MKIQKCWRREWARLLGKVLVLAVMIGCVSCFIKMRRIEGDGEAPSYQDGDLVLAWRLNNEPFLQLRVRGFGD